MAVRGSRRRAARGAAGLEGPWRPRRQQRGPRKRRPRQAPSCCGAGVGVGQAAPSGTRTCATPC
eukprot:5563750-Alexandrium_andersonii.AAC.1